ESQFIGRVIMLRNITPFKEMDLAKTNFMGTISHEFKTPISSIKMSLQLLENKQIGDLNMEQRSLIDGIKEDTERLLKITGELLNISPVESDSIQINIRTCRISENINSAVNATRSLAEQKNVQVKLKEDSKVKSVMGYGEKSPWVLSSFPSNAIRYSYV